MSDWDEDEEEEEEEEEEDVELDRMKSQYGAGNELPVPTFPSLLMFSLASSVEHCNRNKQPITALHLRLQLTISE